MDLICWNCDRKGSKYSIAMHSTDKGPMCEYCINGVTARYAYVPKTGLNGDEQKLIDKAWLYNINIIKTDDAELADMVIVQGNGYKLPDDFKIWTNNCLVVSMTGANLLTLGVKLKLSPSTNHLHCPMGIVEGKYSILLNWPGMYRDFWSTIKKGPEKSEEEPTFLDVGSVGADMLEIALKSIPFNKKKECVFRGFKIIKL